MGFMGRAARMERHHQRHQRNVTLNLVALMDIFTILVFFLLVNSGEVQTLPNAKDLSLPESVAEQRARESVVVVVTEQDLLVPIHYRLVMIEPLQICHWATNVRNTVRKRPLFVITYRS